MRVINFKNIAILALTGLLFHSCANQEPDIQSLKPRIVVLTDIAPNDIEPDDMESMIRLLVHADQFEIEAIIATTGWSNTGGGERIDLIHSALNAYEQDLPNLKKRSDQETFQEDESRQEIGYWPSVNYLRTRTVMGSTKMGMQFIGDGNDSEGSNCIIQLADEKDARPLWIVVWGGGNTFAQAIWRVQQQRTPEELKSFLHQFRVYTITDQDRPWSSGDTINYAMSSHQWMRKFDNDLQFFWDEYALHIQNHGSLGSLYPKYKWGVEGDTPSFMHVMPNGLSDPDIATQVSWSGYFKHDMGRDSLTRCYTNYTGVSHEISTHYFHYFYQSIFNNFAARMDWAKEGKGNRNPVVEINETGGIDAVKITCKAGEVIKLDASESYDPDGDRLSFKWWIIPEAGTYSDEVKITDIESDVAMIHIPTNSANKQIHVICEVTDNGIHNLSCYRRIIIEAQE